MIDTQLPILIKLSGLQVDSLAQYSGELSAYGFVVDSFGHDGYVIRSCPAILAGTDIQGAFIDLLDSIREGKLGAGLDRVAMSLACHSAIRAGKQLSVEEMNELLAQLRATNVPNTCPHGRPTMINITTDSLARSFGRR